MLRTQRTVETICGTPGYYPDWRDVADGCVTWDIWALCAIILESDMEKDEYYTVKQERGALGKAQGYLERKGVSKYLKEIVRGTILLKGVDRMLTLDEIIALLKKVEFM